MKRVCGVMVAGALALATAASPATAKLNSCEGPIVLGTTISVTGTNSSLAGRWDKMTEMFEREFNKTGGVFLSSCNKKLPIKIIQYDDQRVAATAVSLYEKMATVDNVDLFVGPDWSTHGFPVSQVFEKYKIPSVMSNVATPKLYQSGFHYISGMALDAATWSKNYFDMVSQMNPKPKSVFWIVQDNLVTKAVHMFELTIKIEPFGPAVERRTPLLAHIIVAAAAVDLRIRIAGAPAKPVEDFSRPPVEMGIDDTHGVRPSILTSCRHGVRCLARA